MAECQQLLMAEYQQLLMAECQQLLMAESQACKSIYTHSHSSAVPDGNVQP
jgi:hypothetical protein